MKETLLLAFSVNQTFLKDLKPYTSENRGLNTRVLLMTRLMSKELTELNLCLSAKSPNILNVQRHYQKFVNTFNTLIENPSVPTDVIKFIDGLAAHINLFRVLDPQCTTHIYMFELIAYYLRILDKQNIVRSNMNALQNIMPSRAICSTPKTPEESSKTALLQSEIEKKSSEQIIEPMDPAMPIALYIHSLLNTHNMTDILAFAKQLIKKISAASDEGSIPHIELLYHFTEQAETPNHIRKIIIHILTLITVHKPDDSDLCIQEAAIKALQKIKERYAHQSDSKNKKVEPMLYQASISLLTYAANEIIKPIEMSSKANAEVILVAHSNYANILGDMCKKAPLYKHDECLKILEKLGKNSTSDTAQYIKNAYEAASAKINTITTSFDEKAKVLPITTTINTTDVLHEHLVEGNINAIIYEQNQDIHLVIKNMNELVHSMLTQASQFREIYKSKYTKMAKNQQTLSEDLHGVTISILKKIQLAQSTKAMYIYGRLIEVVMATIKKESTITHKKHSLLTTFLEKSKLKKLLNKLDQTIAETLYTEAESAASLSEFLFHDYANSTVIRAIKSLKDLYHKAAAAEHKSPLLRSAQPTDSKSTASIQKKAKKIREQLLEPQITDSDLSGTDQKIHESLINLSHEILQKQPNQPNQPNQPKKDTKSEVLIPKKTSQTTTLPIWQNMAQTAHSFYECILKRYRIQNKEKINSSSWMHSKAYTIAEKNTLMNIYCAVSKHKMALEAQKRQLIAGLTSEEKNQTFITPTGSDGTYTSALEIGSLFKEQPDKETFLAIVDSKPKGQHKWAIATDIVACEDISKDMLRAIDGREVVTFTKIP